MKKIEMIKEVSEITGVSRKDVESVIKAYGEVVLDVIAKNDSVKLDGVCIFKGVDKDARDYRNPQDGSVIHKAASSGNPKCVFTKAAKEV